MLEHKTLQEIHKHLHKLLHPMTRTCFIQINYSKNVVGHFFTTVYTCIYIRHSHNHPIRIVRDAQFITKLSNFAVRIIRQLIHYHTVRSLRQSCCWCFCHSSIPTVLIELNATVSVIQLDPCCAHRTRTRNAQTKQMCVPPLFV